MITDERDLLNESEDETYYTSGGSCLAEELIFMEGGRDTNSLILANNVYSFVYNHNIRTSINKRTTMWR